MAIHAHKTTSVRTTHKNWHPDLTLIDSIYSVLFHSYPKDESKPIQPSAIIRPMTAILVAIVAVDLELVQ